MAERPPGDEKRPGEEFRDQVSRKEERKLQARRERERGIWFGLGMFGLIGWSIMIPTLIGVAIGVWIDTRWPSRISWTLICLLIGVILGCLNAWFWIKRESGRD